MKTNLYQGDSESFSVQHLADDAVEGTGQRLELDRVGHNRLVGNSSSGAVAPAIVRPGPFPLRTLMVCFTIWLIATQAMIFDQIKFDERAHLLEQQSRSLGVPRVIIPNEPASNLPTGAKVQRL